MLWNSNKEAHLNEGQCYYRKQGCRGSVRKIISIRNGKVTYERLWGTSLKVGKRGICSITTFRNWINGEIVEMADYSMLDGCTLYPTYICLDTKGEAVFRCSTSRATFYLKRGYATQVAPDTIQFTTDDSPNKVRELYGDLTKFPFFMHPKNDKCVCCGATVNLTRHHIVPRRHKKRLPPNVTRFLSNVLFVCDGCHRRYERFSELEPHDGVDDPIAFCLAWRDHFISVMKPRFVPDGWDIFSRNPLDGSDNSGETLPRVKSA